jgi:hypothetical protein
VGGVAGAIHAPLRARRLSQCRNGPRLEGRM